MHRLADLLMGVTVPVCNDAEEDDGTFYVPLVVICAVKDHQLIGTTLHFSQHQPEEVARILRITADHLEGKPTDMEAEIIRGGYVQ